MSSIENQIYDLINAVHDNLSVVLGLLFILWAIHTLNWLVGYRLNLLGIQPRTSLGWLGIPFAPFLHGDFNHLFFNSIPLFILANFMLLEGLSRFIWISAAISVISGGLLWLLGRRGIHVGASAVIMGYWGYSVAYAWRHPSLLNVLLVFVCLYYLGGLVGGLFPGKRQESWEGHVFGCAAGVLLALLPGI